MYFIELIVKKIGELRNKNKNTEDLTMLEHIEDKLSDVEDFEHCKHTFMPVDSTGETLACSNCGFLIKKEDLPKYTKNPFANGGLQ